MPPYSLSDPAVAAFVIIPVLLSAVFAFGVAHAWRRSGASRSATARAVMFAIAGAAGWMAVTAAITRSGVLREWDRNPPPFMLLVVGVLAIAGGIALSPLGRRLA